MGSAGPGQSLEHFGQRQLLAWKWGSAPESYPGEMGGPETHSISSGVSRQAVIRAHQDQLDEMAELGFKEEMLMRQLAPNVSAFDWTFRSCWELACSFVCCD